MPLVGGSMTVLWSLVGDRESSTLAACTSKACEGFQVGNLVGDDNQGGPCLHNVKSTNCWAVMSIHGSQDLLDYRLLGDDVV